MIHVDLHAGGCLLLLLWLGGVATIPAVAVALARRKAENLGATPAAGGSSAAVARRRLLAVVIPVSGLAGVTPLAFAMEGLRGVTASLTVNATLFGLIAVPLAVLANRTSRGMAVLAVGGTLGALSFLVPAYWAAIVSPGAEDGLIEFGPVWACGPAGIGLGIGFLIERRLHTRSKG